MSRWSDLVAEIALGLTGAADDELDGVVVDALERVAAVAAAGRAYVTALDLDDGTFEISHEWVAGDRVPQRPVLQRVPIADFAWSVELAGRGGVLVVDDLDELPVAADAERASFRSFGVHSVLQVPIVVDRATIGLLGLNRFSAGDPWDTEVVARLGSAAAVIGIGLIRRRATRAVGTASALATAAERARRDLLGNVSHELRTPLHAILGYSELLALEARSPTERDALDQIQSNGRHLLAMIDDLIALARPADAGESVRRIDLGPVVDEAVAELEHIARARGIGLTVGSVARDASMWVESSRIRQVVRGAIVGAVQSMFTGTITVHVDAGGVVRLSLDSSRPIVCEGLVLPITDALLTDRGSIDVARERGRDDAAAARRGATVTIRFIDPDRAAAQAAVASP